MIIKKLKGQIRFKFPYSYIFLAIFSLLLFLQIYAGKYGVKMHYALIYYLINVVPILYLIIGYKKKLPKKSLILISGYSLLLLFLLFIEPPLYYYADIKAADVLLYSTPLTIPLQIFIFYRSFPFIKFNLAASNYQNIDTSGDDASTHTRYAVSPKPIIFLAFSNPSGPQFLEQLKTESKKLRDLLMPLHKSQKIELLREESLDSEELPKLFTQYKDQIIIFHFGGHASGKTIKLESGEGNIYGLAEILSLQKGLKFIFLNGCRTQEQVKPYLKAGVSVVLATSHSILDNDATIFAEHFYHALINHHSIKEAFIAASGALKIYTSSFTKEARGNMIVTYRDELPLKPNQDDFPWKLYVQEGMESSLDWKLKYAYSSIE